jgi:hypothetical protein
MPVSPISYAQVFRVWMKFSQKKLLDSMKTTAFLLKNQPTEYINVITVPFNKSALKSIVFEDSKYAKVICLSKDGLYPEENRLCPISLLSKLGKLYERWIHEHIMNWYV